MPQTLILKHKCCSKVLLPVGLPDEATFDWVDQFLSKNKPGPFGGWTEEKWRVDGIGHAMVVVVLPSAMSSKMRRGGGSCNQNRLIQRC